MAAADQLLITSYKHLDRQQSFLAKNLYRLFEQCEKNANLAGGGLRYEDDKKLDDHISNGD